ncbi:MAG: NADH-quinone oxidoreductase subunit NuoE [Steroidobacteraceae bacterium]|nr:NADH-quinone oxidoreductase subunit NuoE [Steroidobacteraceae bacterium]MCC7198394.1 NADH-quinone oxidoreductase subunit NuoE [Gammaproteobacteria bacterium]
MKHLIPEFEQLRKRFPAGFESSLLLPCLRRIQEDRGYVADEDIDGLVAWLGVPRIQVEEVLSFYGQLRRKPAGRWNLQVCHNVSCSMHGAERLIDNLSERLGVTPGQTTTDGRFTLTRVECLGSCGTAPVMMVNDQYRENVREGDLDSLLGELK